MVSCAMAMKERWPCLPALAWEMQNPVPPRQASSTILCRWVVHLQAKIQDLQISGEVCGQEMVPALLAGGNSSSVTFKWSKLWWKYMEIVKNTWEESANHFSGSKKVASHICSCLLWFLIGGASCIFLVWDTWQVCGSKGSMGKSNGGSCETLCLWNEQENVLSAAIKWRFMLYQTPDQPIRTPCQMYGRTARARCPTTPQTFSFRTTAFKF